MKELKIKDVMVGDWVDVRNNATPDTPHFEKIIPSHFLRDEYWYGIELVPEILEKNGFEKWDDGWCIYDQENTGIEVAWAGTILKIGGECGNLELPAVMYVHQLQHALRLCGIEKEIVL